MAEASPWRVSDRVATLSDGERSGEITLDRPDCGMTKMRWANASVGGRLWGWTVHDHAEGSTTNTSTPPLLDAYARGADLVLTYGPTETCAVETQLYWRSEPSRLSLLVSIRTHLLDTLPIVRVASEREATETRLARHGDPLSFDNAFRPDGQASGRSPAAKPGAVALRQELAGGMTLCEACHPDDGTELQTDQDRGGVGWEMFSHFLEKGVIRRARLSFTAAGIGDANRVAAEAYAQMLAEPLPLTT